MPGARYSKVRGPWPAVESRWAARPPLQDVIAGIVPGPEFGDAVRVRLEAPEASKSPRRDLIVMFSPLKFHLEYACATAESLHCT